MNAIQRWDYEHGKFVRHTDGGYVLWEDVRHLVERNETAPYRAQFHAAVRCYNELRAALGMDGLSEHEDVLKRARELRGPDPLVVELCEALDERLSLHVENPATFTACGKPSSNSRNDRALRALYDRWKNAPSRLAGSASADGTPGLTRASEPAGSPPTSALGPAASPDDVKAGTLIPPHVAAVYEAAMAWAKERALGPGNRLVSTTFALDAACRAAREVKS